MFMSNRSNRAVVLALVLGLLLPNLAGADALRFDPKQQSFTAQFHASRVQSVLGRVATATGWKVYVEPGATNRVSTEFRNLPVADALRLLLGELNFALLPQSNGPPKLLVYRNQLQNATSVVVGTHPSAILNELIVRVRPGIDIQAVAKALNAKVMGKIAGLNAYRLQFADAEAADAARETLQQNPEIAAVEDNHNVARQPVGGQMGQGPFGPVSLKLKPPPSDGRVVVGLIDTAVQSLGKELDAFVLPTIKVAGNAPVENSYPTHGTTMAETLLRSLQAATQGSTSVQILPVDVYGANPGTSTFEVAEGIIRAVNAGARIINLSLGGEGDSPVLRDTIAAVNRQGIPVIAAAGNAASTLPYYPAAYPEVMAVTAVDHGQIAAYANRGDFVSLAAPGTHIVYFNNQAWQVVGTSAASAYVSGLAAGYMETTGAAAVQTQAFLQHALGIK